MEARSGCVSGERPFYREMLRIAETLLVETVRKENP
jgi:hypothetical protein